MQDAECPLYVAPLVHVREVIGQEIALILIEQRYVMRRQAVVARIGVVVVGRGADVRVRRQLRQNERQNRPADLRGPVDAVDGHRQFLRRGAVGAVADLELEFQFLAVAFLYGGLRGGVGLERVCPGLFAVRIPGPGEGKDALAVDGHAVVRHLISHAVHHYEQGVAVGGIHIVEVERAGIMGRCGRIDDRRVIGAFDMDEHGFFRGSALRVRYRDGEAVGSRFTFGQDFGPLVQSVLVGP